MQKNDHALTNEFINILNAFPCSYNGCNYELGSNCNKIYYFHITIAVGKILYRHKWDNLHFYNQNTIMYIIVIIMFIIIILSYRFKVFLKIVVLNLTSFYTSFPLESY